MMPCRPHKYWLAGLLFIIVLVISSGASATCNQTQADKGIQPEMTMCAYDAYQIADKKLNVAYKNRIKQLGDDDNRVYASKSLQALKQSQKAWLKFRDAECHAQAFEYDGGSMQPMIRALCLEALTIERTKQLTPELK